MEIWEKYVWPVASVGAGSPRNAAALTKEMNRVVSVEKGNVDCMLSDGLRRHLYSLGFMAEEIDMATRNVMDGIILKSRSRTRESALANTRKGLAGIENRAVWERPIARDVGMPDETPEECLAESVRRAANSISERLGSDVIEEMDRSIKSCISIPDLVECDDPYEYCRKNPLRDGQILYSPTRHRSYVFCVRDGKGTIQELGRCVKDDYLRKDVPGVDLTAADMVEKVERVIEGITPDVPTVEEIEKAPKPIIEKAEEPLPRPRARRIEKPENRADELMKLKHKGNGGGGILGWIGGLFK